MNKLEKKQIPQFAALCVLSAGAFGYFVVKMVTPSPAAAGTRPQPKVEILRAATTPAKSPAAVPGTIPDGPDAPAPTQGMRDPFVVGLVPDAPAASGVPAAPPAALGKPVKPGSLGLPAKSAVQVASIHEVGPAPSGFPGAPALPLGLKALPPLENGPAAVSVPAVPALPMVPAAPAPPTWTVTGVLQDDATQVAILRSGTARRIVRTGDFVDNVYRIVSVTRSEVVLRHGKTFYHLTLGAAKTAPDAVKPALVPTMPSLPVTPAGEPQELTLDPAGSTAPPKAELTQAVHAVLMLAQAQVDSCLASFHARA